MRKFLLVASHPESLISFRGHLIRSIQKNGIEVHVAAPFSSRTDVLIRNKIEAMDVTVHEILLQRTGVNPFKDGFVIYQLWKLMRKIGPDFFLGYTIKPVIYGTLAAWLAGIPNRFALVTGLGYIFKDVKKKTLIQGLIFFLYSLSVSLASKVFFQNKDDFQLFVELNLLKSRTSTCIVNGSGVDLSYYSISPLPSSPIRFLLIARLLRSKGIREYVTAARILQREYPSVTFGLAGWMDKNPDSINDSELAESITDGSIQFLGKLLDVRPAIANCHIYVLPSYREGTPRSVLEAMAMGRPIITTDTPGCRETVINEKNGFLIKVGDAHALADSMRKFIRSPEIILSMGEASRKIAENKFDVNKVNDIMLREMGI